MRLRTTVNDDGGTDGAAVWVALTGPVSSGRSLLVTSLRVWAVPHPVFGTIADAFRPVRGSRSRSAIWRSRVSRTRIWPRVTIVFAPRHLRAWPKSAAAVGQDVVIGDHVLVGGCRMPRRQACAPGWTAIAVCFLRRARACAGVGGSTV